MSTYHGYTLPVARLTPQALVFYPLSVDNYYRSERQLENEKNLTRGHYNGYMSPKTKSKVRRYLGTWLESIKQINRSPDKRLLEKKPYLTFVTLTLPSKQVHSDNEIKRTCLTPFIETLKRKYSVWNYFWRAEAQENENIHFHIIIDSYIEWQKIRKEWNKCVNKLKYVDEFERKHGHNDPNSTDIHGLKNIKSIEAYVIKYCCKQDGYRPIKGRLHGCSDDIRKLMPYEFVMNDEDFEMMNLAMLSCPYHVHNDPSFTFMQMPVLTFLKEIKSNHLPKMIKHYEGIAINLYNNPDPREQDKAPFESKDERLNEDETRKMIRSLEVCEQLVMKY